MPRLKHALENQYDFYPFLVLLVSTHETSNLDHSVARYSVGSGGMYESNQIIFLLLGSAVAIACSESDR